MKRVETLERLFKTIHRMLFEIAKDTLQANGITRSIMEIVVFTLNKPGTTVSQLARGTKLSKSYVSSTVEHLSSKDFLEKRPDKNDKRLIRIYATDKAHTHFREVRHLILERFRGVLSILTDDELDDIIDSLHKLKLALEQISSVKIRDDIR